MLKQLNAACWVTVSRISLLPAAVLCIWLDWHYGLLLAAVICVLAGLTDALDGYLARRTKCITSLGSGLDLLADKLFVSAVMISLALREVIPFWVPGIIVLREVVVSLMRFHRFEDRLSISPDRLGKLKMAVSMIAIVWLLLWQDLHQGGPLAVIVTSVPVIQLVDLAWWVTMLVVTLTILSGLNYFVRYALIVTRIRSVLPQAKATPSTQL